MLFNSFPFIFLFLPLVVGVFFAIGSKGKHRTAIAWLVLASLFYYGWWKLEYLVLIVGSIFFNYALGLALSRDGVGAKPAKSMLVFGVTANLLLLGWYKYAGFFAANLKSIAGVNWDPGSIVLPLAISFFTFQQVAYLVDAYRGETREHNFLHYCLFVTFFPQLIAGPIVHHKEVLPQFSQKRIFQPNHKDMAIGLTIFLLGLFEKVVLADRAAFWATPVFDAAVQGQQLTLAEAWGGSLAYTFQLFFDFCGYSDMAIGMARIMGVRLPMNFRSPYKSSSIIDFWRRWHITLSRFLRDYLYIPLGGSRGSTTRRYGNLMATMVLGGLWHGAGWTFVAWGTLHGFYLMVNHGWRSWRSRFSEPSVHDPMVLQLWRRFWPTALTFLSVVLAWVFFRAESFQAAMIILKGMVGLGASGLRGELFALREAALILVLGVIAFRFPSVIEWADETPEDGEAPLQGIWQKLAWRPHWAWAVLVTGAGLMAILDMARISEFLYYNF